jgi:broad-specificity NMP kinase
MSPDPDRIVIVGGPKVGKSTLAAKFALEGYEIKATDDLVKPREPGGHSIEWSQLSDEVATWYSRPGRWVVEGVAAPRALRKWLRSHSTGTPCDLLLIGSHPREKLKKRGQITMTAAVKLVLSEILPELRARGVTVGSF